MESLMFPFIWPFIMPIAMMRPIFEFQTAIMQKTIEKQPEERIEIEQEYKTFAMLAIDKVGQCSRWRHNDECLHKNGNGACAIYAFSDIPEWCPLTKKKMPV